jgi:hypothetical protein
MKVNILGHDYKFSIFEADDIPEDLKIKASGANGICENYSEELVVFKFKNDGDNYKRLDLLEEKAAVHELLHAYMFKSGAGQLLTNQAEEVIVDMLAINFDNISNNRFKILNELRKSYDE